LRLKISTVIVFAMFGLALAPQQAALVEVPIVSARYEALQSEALRFFRAVRNGDKPTLVRLTPAAGRDAVRKDLDDPTSSRARMLLTGSRAMRGRFMSVQTPRLTFVRQRDQREADDRVLVCFSDPRQGFRTPATTSDLPSIDSNRSEMCVPFVWTDRQWAVILDGAR
jgi:hypothetical protein